MLKISSLIITLSLFTVLNGSEQPLSCSKLFQTYELYPELKSSNGWKRVIKKNNIHHYTDVVILSNDLKNLKKCLISKSFNISKLDRGIGSQ